MSWWDVCRGTLDLVCGVAVVATLVGWLPPTAALFTIVFYALRILEIIERRKARKNHAAR